MVQEQYSELSRLVGRRFGDSLRLKDGSSASQTRLSRSALRCGTRSPARDDVGFRRGFSLCATSQLEWRRRWDGSVSGSADRSEEDELSTRDGE
jgi:hypothetical protein